MDKFTKDDGYNHFTLRGTIKPGCQGIKANCGKCGKVVMGLKFGEKTPIQCAVCGSVVTPVEGAKEFPRSLPYFLVPDEVKAVTGEKPTCITVLPAYRNIERCIPNSYTLKNSTGNIICSGNGMTGARWNNDLRRKVPVSPCGEECADVKNKRCEMSGTFYFLIPQVDVMSMYRMQTSSEENISNILSTLRKCTDRNGDVVRLECDLIKIEKKSLESGNIYHIVDLVPPSVSIDKVRELNWGPRPGSDMLAEVNR